MFVSFIIFTFIFKPLSKQSKQNQPHGWAEMTTVKDLSILTLWGYKLCIWSYHTVSDSEITGGWGWSLDITQPGNYLWEWLFSFLFFFGSDFLGSSFACHNNKIPKTLTFKKKKRHLRASFIPSYLTAWIKAPEIHSLIINPHLAVACALLE